MTRPLENGACIAPNCDDDQHCRNLCSKHYRAACRVVKRGDATWESLEAAGLVGLARPRTPGPRRNERWLLAKA